MSLATFFQTVEKDAETVAEDVYNALLGVLKPLAVATVQASETAIVNAATSGNWDTLGSTLGAALTAIGKQALAQGTVASVDAASAALTAAIVGNTAISNVTPPVAPST